MSNRIAALSAPALTAVPLAPTPPRAAPSGTRGTSPLLCTLVDWALERLGPRQLQGLGTAEEASARVAMIAGHFAALAELSRHADAQGVRLVHRNVAVVDAGHLTRPAPAATDRHAAEVGGLLIGAPPRLRSPEQTAALATVLRSVLRDMSLDAPQVVVLASYGSRQPPPRPAAVEAMNLSMGVGRPAILCEIEVEASLWESLEARVSALHEHTRAVPLLRAIEDLWSLLKPGGGLHQALPNARGFVGSEILDRLYPLVDGLRGALADGSIDPERARTLVVTSLSQARDAVRRHDDALPVPRPRLILPAAMAHAQPDTFADADATAMSAPIAPPDGAQSVIERLLWRTLDRTVSELHGLLLEPGALVERIERLVSDLGEGGALSWHAFDARPVMQVLLMQRLLPAVSASLQGLRAGEIGGAAAVRQISDALQEAGASLRHAVAG